MARKISRRNLLAGVVTAGLAANPLPSAAAQAPRKPSEPRLPDVWGQEGCQLILILGRQYGHAEV